MRIDLPKTRGSSLIMVLIGFTIVSGISMLLMRSLTQSTRLQRRTSVKGAAESVRAAIEDELDCAGTLTANGINAGNIATLCPSTSAGNGQVGPFLRLRRATNAGGMDFAPTWDGTTGTMTLAGWTVRASCSVSERRMIIRVARPDGSGGFLNDPALGTPANWQAPSGLLFGSANTATSICSLELGGPTPPSVVQCADPEEYMVAIDLATRTLTCRPMRASLYLVNMTSGLKVNNFSQSRGGIWGMGVDGALPVHNCQRTVAGHDDWADVQYACPAGWSDNGVLGYFMQ